MARRGRYQYTARRKQAWRKAQLKGARMRKGNGRKRLAIAAGVGVLAVGAGAAVIYGRQKRGAPRTVINHPPPQANPNNDVIHHKGKIFKMPDPTAQTSFLKAKPWHIGDDAWPVTGDAIEVSLPRPKPLGGGHSRLYGVMREGRKKTVHSTMYKVSVRNSSGALLEDFVYENQITGVKVGGSANLADSIKTLKEQRKKHRY